MMTTRSRRVQRGPVTWALLAGLCSVAFAARATAQPIGTFRWQLEPYCNVVTLNVTQHGAVFTLDGFDDQCGAGQRASVVGTAFLNPDGAVGIGLNTVLAPGGAFVHVDARISIASLGGPFRDSAGNSGTFVLTTAAGSGGSPRPVAPNGIAPGSITAGQIAPGAVRATHLAQGAVSGSTIAGGSITTAHILDGPRAAFHSGPDFITLPTTPTVVRSVYLNIPAPGQVIVNASGTFNFPSSTISESGVCFLRSTASVVDTPGSLAFENFQAGMNFVPFGLTHGFDVSAGSFTVNLLCVGGSAGSVMWNPSLTAFFVAGS